MFAAAAPGAEPGAETCAIGLINVVAALVNLVGLVANGLLWYARRAKCYDRSATILEEEQGPWYVNFVIERELARIYAHYTKDGQALVGVEAPADEMSESEVSSGDASDQGTSDSSEDSEPDSGASGTESSDICSASTGTSDQCSASAGTSDRSASAGTSDLCSASAADTGSETDPFDTGSESDPFDDTDSDAEKENTPGAALPRSGGNWRGAPTVGGGTKRARGATKRQTPIRRAFQKARTRPGLPGPAQQRPPTRRAKKEQLAPTCSLPQANLARVEAVPAPAE